MTNHAPPMVMELAQQDAVAVEQIASGNKKQVDVYVVIKNQPFNIYLKSTNTTRVNFNTSTIKAQLYYDCDPPKPVDYIQHEPLQYVVTPNNSGSEASIEVKIGILSSQHQGSLFLVVLRAADHPDYVTSHPIRIVSKIDHIRKEGVSIKKPTFNEIIMDRLSVLEAQQEDHIKLLHKMLDKQGTNTSSPSILTQSTSTASGSPPYSSPYIPENDSPTSSPSSPSSPISSSTSTPATPTRSYLTPSLTSNSTTKSNTNSAPPTLEAMSRKEVESYMAKMLVAFAKIDPEDRSTEIRKLVVKFGASLEKEMSHLEKAFARTPIVKEEPYQESGARTRKRSLHIAIPQRAHSPTSVPFLSCSPSYFSHSPASPATHLSRPSTPTLPATTQHFAAEFAASMPKAQPAQQFSSSHAARISFSPSRSSGSIPPPSSSMPAFSTSPAATQRLSSKAADIDADPESMDMRISESGDSQKPSNFLSRSFPLSPMLSSSIPANIQQQLSSFHAPPAQVHNTPSFLHTSMEIQNTPVYSHQHEFQQYSQPPQYNPPSAFTPSIPSSIPPSFNVPETAYLLIHPQYRNQAAPAQQQGNATAYSQGFFPNQASMTYQELIYKSGGNLQIAEEKRLVKPETQSISSPQTSYSTPPHSTPPYSTPPFMPTTPPQITTSNESFMVQQVFRDLSQKSLTDQQIQQQIALYVQHLNNQAMAHQAQHQLQQQQQQQPPQIEGGLVPEFMDRWQF